MEVGIAGRGRMRVRLEAQHISQLLVFESGAWMIFAAQQHALNAEEKFISSGTTEGRFGWMSLVGPGLNTAASMILTRRHPLFRGGQ